MVNTQYTRHQDDFVDTVYGGGIGLRLSESIENARIDTETVIYEGINVTETDIDTVVDYVMNTLPDALKSAGSGQMILTIII